METMENTEVENTATGSAEEGNTKKETGKEKKRGHKILIQIGAIMIILFTLVTVAVGNMVTMASFSTSLGNNMTIFKSMMEYIIESMKEYESLPWLMDYWKENAGTLFSTENGPAPEGDVNDILDHLSKTTPEEVAVEEAKKLSPEEQKEFAARCYLDIKGILEQYQEDKNYTMVITIPSESEEDEEIAIFNSEDKGDNSILGSRMDLTLTKKIVANTEKATDADVWRWAFTTPDQMMLFAACLPFSDYIESSTAQMYGVMMADVVYEDMKFTESIRNEVIVMMVVVFILILLFLYFIVPRPLEKLKQCVSEYSDTKDTDELVKKLSGIHSRNEIGAFADEFSALALEIERYTHEMAVLAGERERIETELNVAKNIQDQMLPQEFPENVEFSVYASMDPAKEVGGDFYDCYMLDDDHLVLTIADVSGKGVPASLFMAVSKTMLKNRTVVGGTPSAILTDVNNWLCEGNDNCMFVTVWLGILTISTGELICSNAGHENPGFRSKGKGFRLVKTEHGSPLGLMEDMEFKDEKYMLSPGDAVFVYTDGVPEANASDESMFGEKRLEEVLSAVSENDSPQIIMQKVRKAVDEFAGDTPQFDDLTMLCFTLNPSKE